MSARSSSENSTPYSRFTLALRFEQREGVIAKVGEGLVRGLLDRLGGLVLPRALAHDVLKVPQCHLPHG